MPRADNSSIALRIWKAIESLHLSLSPSHDRWHIDRVMTYARELSRLHGGDLRVITAAVILHDLGRSDPSLKDVESAAKSAQLARDILRRSGFPDALVEYVVTAIQEHDQPDLKPSTVEARILKDADFLAGFGTWGVLRIAMWAGETKGGVDQVFNRLEEKMPNRLWGLEFQESRRLAKREMAFARLFASLLRRSPDLSPIKQKGYYIVLEGIDGAGKNIQGKMLHERLSKKSQQVLLVDEPTPLYKTARNLWENQRSDPFIQTFLLMADRYKQIKTVIRPALETGQIVLSIRSYLSTIVYQTDETYQQDFIDFFHQFVPIPDVVFVLDLSPETAHARIKRRAELENKAIGEFETPEALTRQRQRYKQVAEHRPSEGFVFVNAEKSIAEVGNDMWRHLANARVVDE